MTRRIRRTLYGAKVEFSIRKNGSIRLKVDHPSNDPAVEVAISGFIMAGLEDGFNAYGIGPLLPSGPLVWRDDEP